MPVPTYDRFIEPIIRFLAMHPEGVKAGKAHDAAADALGLTLEEKQEFLSSSGQKYYKNRASWAHDRLKRAGLSTSPSRGVWRLSEQALALIAQHPSGLPDELVNQIATEYNHVVLKGNQEELTSPTAEEAMAEETLLSPDERIEIALTQILTNVASGLLERLSQVDPSRFERIVLDLLHKMGYGATREDLKQTPDSNDGGIDGIISLDALGLERVYVQAKRWAQATVVGRPEIQGSDGALAGHKAVKGVSSSPQALANRPPNSIIASTVSS